MLITDDMSRVQYQYTVYTHLIAPCIVSAMFTKDKLHFFVDVVSKQICPW